MHEGAPQLPPVLGDFTRIIRLIKDGQPDTRPWSKHHAGFEAMIGVFPSWTKPETGVITVVVAVDNMPAAEDGLTGPINA